MAASIETNIIVPRCAVEALGEHCRRNGLKRDPAVRALIQNYNQTQATLTSERRLTHISTVIWHPDMPLHRNTSAPDSARLRLRLAEATRSVAVGYALQLPGQVVGPGGHHDYRPRLLADAFLTALALATEFSDEVLQGLPAMLTQQQALGLFRLGVAASATWAEQRIYRRADRDLDLVHRNDDGPAPTDSGTDHAIDIATLLREEDIAWHGQWRREVIRHLARDLLTGPETADNLSMLQRQDHDDFGSHRRLLEQDNQHRRDVLDRLRPPHYDAEGRGGTAIWRAERRVQTDRMLRWLARSEVERGTGPDTLVMREPGWSLALPGEWHAVTIRGNDPDQLRPHQALQARGQVLHAMAGATHIFWPYQHTGPGSLQPVPAFRTVLAAAGDRSPERIIEYLLVRPDEDASGGPIYMNAFIACEFGYIGEGERDRLVRSAQQESLTRMEDYIRCVPAGQPELRQLLRDARHSPAEFTRITKGGGFKRMCPALAGEPFEEVRTRVHWPRTGVTLLAEIEAGPSEAQLRWLTGYLFRRFDLLLEDSMQDAWKRAMQGYRSSTWSQIADCDTDLSKGDESSSDSWT